MSISPLGVHQLVSHPLSNHRMVYTFNFIQFPRLNWIQWPEFWFNAIGPVLIHNKILYSIVLDTHAIRKSVNWTTWTECIQLWIHVQKCYTKLVISNGEAITFLGSLGHQRHVKGTKYKWIFVLWFLLLHCQYYVIQLPFILLCDQNFFVMNHFLKSPMTKKRDKKVFLQSQEE